MVIQSDLNLLSHSVIVSLQFGIAVIIPVFCVWVRGPVFNNPQQQLDLS